MKVFVLFTLIALTVADFDGFSFNTNFGSSSSSRSSNTKSSSSSSSNSDSYETGLAALTNPAVEGIANPLLYGTGRGVYAASAGTQKTADLLGDTVSQLVHTLGGILGNTEQGVGVAASNVAPAVQGTVKAVQDNSGLVGDAVRTLTGAGH